MKRLFYFGAALIAVLTHSCRADKITALDGFALGTTYAVRITDANVDKVILQDSLDALFERVENSMSLYRENSLLSKINRAETDSLDKYITQCITKAVELSKVSGGRYDVTTEPLVAVWGFLKDSVATEPNIDSIMTFVGYDKIAISNGRLVKADPRVRIDLNSIAKGYTSDLVGAMLESMGIKHYVIEIGGEIFCRAKNKSGDKWIVGIDKPFDNNLVPGNDIQTRIALSDKGLATSGNYRRFHTDTKGCKITHILNALTGRSEPSNLLSVTVIADDCMTADAYATLLMCAGLDEAKMILEQHPELMGYMIFSDENGNYCEYLTPNIEKLIVR